MHGSKGRGWKRALATARGSEHRRETGGISATAYGSYRASPLPDLICKGPTWWPLPSARDAVREPVPCFYSHSPRGRVDPVHDGGLLPGGAASWSTSFEGQPANRSRPMSGISVQSLVMVAWWSLVFAVSRYLRSRIFGLPRPQRLVDEYPPRGGDRPSSHLVWRTRSQISCWWARARMRTAAASSLSPATGRWLWRSVRTRSVSSFASPASDLAPPTW